MFRTGQGCDVSEAQDITELLNAANSGDAAAQETAYGLLYAELKRCAVRQRHISPDVSLSSTALVHELFLRLQQRRMMKIDNRAHFFGMAARAMRQIIVDYARQRGAIKRGGKAIMTDADGALEMDAAVAAQALELDDALNKLAVRDADLARIVEWHFFAGLSFSEIGEQLGRHQRTVERDWALARVLLRQSMGAIAAP
jgi:RNA polymerase sigma factor (TIGR02999 family)